MSGYQLAPAAKRDFAEIITHSLSEWGTKQTESYKNKLIKCVETAATNPEIGKLFSKRYEKLRYILSGKYYIFFLKKKQKIIILAFFHQRMHITSRLPERLR